MIRLRHSSPEAGTGFSGPERAWTGLAGTVWLAALGLLVALLLILSVVGAALARAIA